MKNRIILIFITLISVFYVCELRSQENHVLITSHSFKKNIMLVPFDPKIYINDATSIIAKRDSISHDEIMLFFREKFDNLMYNSLTDSCYIFSFISSNTRDDQDELYDLYSAIHYELIPTMSNKKNESKTTKSLNFVDRVKREKEEEKRKEEVLKRKTRTKNGEIQGGRPTGTDLFLNIVFRKPEVLKNFAKKNKIDYFLFINQFEIKGNYGDPYISGNSKAKRTITVHYSIYDRQGKLFYGNKAKSDFPFDLDNKQEIVNKYFPRVTRNIIKNIPFRDL